LTRKMDVIFLDFGDGFVYHIPYTHVFDVFRPSHTSPLLQLLTAGVVGPKVVAFVEMATH